MIILSTFGGPSGAKSRKATCPEERRAERASRVGLKRPPDRIRDSSGGKRDSIHHHLLEVIFETATVPELRQTILYTTPSGWWRIESISTWVRYFGLDIASIFRSDRLFLHGLGQPLQQLAHVHVAALIHLKPGTILVLVLLLLLVSLLSLLLS